MPDNVLSPTPDPELVDEQNYNHWFFQSWRPLMAYQYFTVCVFDFIVAPILCGVWSAISGQPHMWTPITLQAGGIYHLSMGGIVGVTAWSRGQEKMQLFNNLNNGGDAGDQDANNRAN